MVKIELRGQHSTGQDPWFYARINQAPKIAVKIAGMPNVNVIFQLIVFLNRINLKILLRRCTKAVVAIAKGRGKKMAMMGISNVLSPNPEYKVMKDVKKAERLRIKRVMGSV
jgi:hypothetical protein